jgi:hypothetical protein
VKRLERAMTDFGDGSAVAIAWRNKEVHQPIERLGILLATCFKYTIRKKI